MSVNRRALLLGAAGLAFAGRPAQASVAIERRYVDGPVGQIHVRVARPADQDVPLQTPLACFHPSPASGRLFNPVLPLLAKDRIVMAFDTPGYGYSDPPQDQPDISLYSKALRGAVSQVVPDQKVDLFGRMTGALIATEMAVTEPEAVRKVVLSRAPVFTEETRRFGVEEMLRRWRERQLDTKGQYLIDRLTRNLGRLAEGELPELYMGSFIDSVLPGHNWVYGEVAAFSYRADLMMPKITQPVLFLTWIEPGQTDGPFGSVNEWTRGKEIIPDVVHHNFSGLGRWAWENHGELITDQVLKFLDA